MQSKRSFWISFSIITHLQLIISVSGLGEQDEINKLSRMNIKNTLDSLENEIIRDQASLPSKLVYFTQDSTQSTPMSIRDVKQRRRDKAKSNTKTRGSKSKLKTPKPKQMTSPRQKCVLPLDPSPIDSSGVTEGVLFGLQFDSRYEYSNLPKYNSGRAEFTVEFKTTSSDGVMFYVAGVNHVDFMALYLKGGVVTFAFNCGSGIGRAATGRPYNDDRWHKATFSRSKNEGSLTLDDGVETVATIAGGSTETVEIIQPAYVGSLPLDVFNAAATNIEESGGFNGCLKNFNYQGMDFGTPVVTVGTQPCSSAIEAGSFFYKDGGHIVLNNSFSVPLDLKVELQIRPRTLSGVLLSVYNNDNPDRGGDYLVLQMVEGNLIFSVDNGKGDISATYSPPAKNALCNGAWHSIVAMKAKNVVMLAVDGVTTAPGVGEQGFSGTDTHHPMYIGGVPAGHRGIRTNDQYVGCLRQLKFNYARADLKLGSARGSVQLDYCPAK